jgi:alkanesulfonate monooxygenase SsuD/methylene tetrahydromethanopterin reductase-like flavin-dependent oxidoreductase (luciferase family)
MRFGSFVFPISATQEYDHEVIENTLREVELAEEIGLDAVWLTEHHFDGAVAYADPLVFAAAAAARTNRVRVGFAVVELALHHPVRLAVQTALLDHLSQGRLIVGTGRGSAFNEYEYMGFGITMEDGREMLPEAEELLVKAWTGENVDHNGRFWKATFPVLRPQPYQKPHPPLVRACITENSLVEMAAIGRPVLIGVQTADTLRRQFQLYHDTMLEAGFAGEAVEDALDQTWAQRALYIGESDQEALEVATDALGRFREHLLRARIEYNPGGVPPRLPGQAPPPGEVVETAFLAGTPQRVIEQITELKDAGVRNLLLNMNVGQMPREQVERSMRAFGEKVLPAFRAG